MSRNARQLSSTDTYHVVIRRADHQLLFEEKKDYQKYLEILQLYEAECQFELYAYCLMPNHIHLLIHSPVTSLGSVFRHVSTTYSSWFNAKYNRTGYLQEGRYFSEPVETEKYLFTVLRYIHQNPIKAGLETVPGETYPWNSFCDYISGINDIVNIEYIFQLLGGPESFRSLHQIMVVEECLDISTLRKRLPDDVARDIIRTECNCETVADFQKLTLLERNNNIILLRKKGLSIRQINRLTGTPKGVIEKIISKKLST